ncbi:hydrogenase-4 component E [Roseomonas acroporae]|uniref:hydrogenase-4 component E n=1 Tax=Roseomonas acroporae TaxID=2937791 RepID=UPI0031F55781
MRFGQLPYDAAHLLGGLVLLLSFVLLYQRRLGAVIRVFAAQGAVLAAAAAWQGWVQGEAGLYVTALIALLAKAVLIPLALDRLVRELQLHRTVETAMGVGPSMAAGVGLVGLALLVVLPIRLGLPPGASGGLRAADAIAASAHGALTRESLAIALSVVLLGMLMMITRRNALTQVVGLMSLENGLVLAAIGVAGMPLVLELSTAALVLMAFAVAGIFVFRIRERFDSVDLLHLDSAVPESDLPMLVTAADPAGGAAGAPADIPTGIPTGIPKGGAAGAPGEAR